MRRLALLGLVLLLTSCSTHHHKPPKPPTPPTPPAEQRVSLDELRARQRFATEHIQFPYGYTAAKLASDIVHGGRPRLDGVEVAITIVSLPMYVYLHGDPAAQEQARAYWRTWLACEKAGCKDKFGTWRDWRLPSMNCSMNWQLTRHGGLFFGTLVLGEAEAARYGDPVKVRAAKARFLDVLTGAAYYDPYGNKIGEGPCAAHGSAGDDPEPYRSRHYGPRCIDTILAAAECGDADVERVAQAEADKVVAHMRPCVREDGLIDPTACPEFRFDTGTRCPGYCPPDKYPPCSCTPVLRQYGLQCGPGETPGVVYIWFKKQWRGEFDGSDERCTCGDQYYFQSQYIFGEKWRPLLK